MEQGAFILPSERGTLPEHFQMAWVHPDSTGLDDRCDLFNRESEKLVH